jgi:hypothetical protein
MMRPPLYREPGVTLRQAGHVHHNRRAPPSCDISHSPTRRFFETLVSLICRRKTAGQINNKNN